MEGDGVTDGDSGDVSELVAAIAAVVVLKLRKKIISSRKKSFAADGNLLLAITQHMRLSSSESLRWPAFELYRSSRTTLLCSLYFSSPRVAKA